MTTRNHVWSNNGDIANDLKWPLIALRGEKNPKFRKGGDAVLLNHYISAAVRAISIKFGMVTQFDPIDRFER